MTINKGDILNFHDALYHIKCIRCGYELEWEAYFDADGTTYSAICCKNSYRMSPNTVKVDWEDVEDD